MNKIVLALCLALVFTASAAFAQEDPGFGPPPSERQLIRIGNLYFYGPQTCVENGEFTNSPEATIRLKQVRCAGGRTYIYGIAQKQQLFYLAGPGKFSSPSMRLTALTQDPAVLQLEVGETFSVIMEGEFDQFELASMLPEDKGEQTADDGGYAPLFTPVPQSQAPWATRRVPEPMEIPKAEPYAWPNGTIEPAPEQKPEPKTPIKMDGPIAGEGRTRS